MAATSAYDPHSIEREVDGLWKARRLPPPGGVLGPADGAVVHQFLGKFTPGEVPEGIAQRAVAADVDARFLALTGRRAVGTLRWEGDGADPAATPAGLLLRGLGIWTGGAGSVPWDSDPRHDRVEVMVGRLARAGVLVSRDLPMRHCPTCAAPRSPERIIYQEEEGDTYLVRFDIPWKERAARALVWVDVPWRLLGTSAILVHPELPYVVARYRRRDAEEVVLTSRSSLDRFRRWLPDATFEVLEERPGKDFAGAVYDYPLRHEFPMGEGLPAPAGTVLPVTDVTDTGTGIVPLVPGHGSTDAAIAEARGVTGWPLLTPKGQLDVTLVHKYAGLDLRTANEFIVRDLTEGGSVFAQLRVRRGVPHCGLCGTPLVWMPGRTWCLEPGRLPADRIDLFRRFLPSAPALPRVEVAPWPVSETGTTEEALGIALLECPRCERLDALDGAPGCSCGGTMFPSRRRLLPPFYAALAGWARVDPFPAEDSVHLYLPERRRAPRLIHHLTGMSAILGRISHTGLTLLPSLPEVELSSLRELNGVDALRSAFVCVGGDTTAAGFADRSSQERRRLARLWSLAEDLLARSDPARLSSFAQPIAGFLRELEMEDRAILARWERTRALAQAAYERFDPDGAHRRLFHFFESDLAEYLEWSRTRLGLAGSPPTQTAILRTLTYILRTGAALLAPITPYLAEVVHRRFSATRSSLFETPLSPSERELLDDELVMAWDRWRSVVGAVNDFRRESGISASTPIPVGAIVLSTDDLADKLRRDRAVLERLANVARFDIGSPREPWPGRRRRPVPIESEIQRVYGAQASQIIHLLQHMPPRRSAEGAGGAELSVVIQGLPRRILPSMIEYRDTLPEGTVPAPWALGEMYLELPPRDRPGRPLPPPLSSDAFWLARRLRRRLRRAPAPELGQVRIAIVSASDPLASELRGVAEPLARYLDLAELRVVDRVDERPPVDRVTGRTRTGAAWWAHVPGLPAVPPREKRRAASAPAQRLRPGSASAAPSVAEVDYADEAVIAAEESARALNQELDELLGAPLIGPAKVRAAFAIGLDHLEEFRETPFEQLAAIPGFGHAIASALVTRLGGTAPPRAARPRPPPSERPPGTRLAESVSPLLVSPRSVAAVAPGTPPEAPAPTLPVVPLVPSRVPPVPASAPPRRATPPEPTSLDVGPSPPSVEEAASPLPSPGPRIPPVPAASSPPEGEAPPRTEEVPNVTEALPEKDRLPPLEASSTEAPEGPSGRSEEEFAPPGGPTPHESHHGGEPVLADTGDDALGPSDSLAIAGRLAETPAPLAPPPLSVEPEPSRGGTELEIGTSVIASLQPFLEATSAGLPGICVVRESPERIAAQVGGRPVDIYWLSNLGRGRTLKPNDLPAISDFLAHHLSEGKVTVFFLEGIEYLVRIHGVEAIVELLLGFGRAARDQEARVWIHVTPDLLKPADLERIRNAFPPSAGFG